MRTTFSLVSVLLSSLLVGQTCDTIEGRLINCVDTSGLKQGYWQERQKNILSSAYSGYGTKGGCQYSESAYYLIKSEGEYAHGRRVGQWIYYYRNGIATDSVTSRSSETQRSLPQAVPRPKQYILGYDSTGNEVQGQVFLASDTVLLRFTGDQFMIEAKNARPIGSFPLAHLDFEIERLFAGVYDREIRSANSHK